MIHYNDINRTYFFSVLSMPKAHGSKLIYRINVNSNTYLLSKSNGLNNCKQLDDNPPLDPAILREISTVLTEVEKKQTHRSKLERINCEIFKIHARLRRPLFT